MREYRSLNRRVNRIRHCFVPKASTGNRILIYNFNMIMRISCKANCKLNETFFYETLQRIPHPVVR